MILVSLFAGYSCLLLDAMYTDSSIDHFKAYFNPTSYNFNIIRNGELCAANMTIAIRYGPIRLTYKIGETPPVN